MQRATFFKQDHFTILSPTSELLDKMHTLDYIAPELLMVQIPVKQFERKWTITLKKKLFFEFTDNWWTITYGVKKNSLICGETSGGDMRCTWRRRPVFSGWLWHLQVMYFIQGAKKRLSRRKDCRDYRGVLSTLNSPVHSCRCVKCRASCTWFYLAVVRRCSGDVHTCYEWKCWTVSETSPSIVRNMYRASQKEQANFCPYYERARSAKRVSTDIH